MSDKEDTRKIVEVAVYEMYQKDKEVMFRQIHHFGDNKQKAESYADKLSRITPDKVYFVAIKKEHDEFFNIAKL